MSKIKVSLSDLTGRIAGMENCTTLTFTLVSGRDWKKPKMWVEAYLRENEELKERREWEFPELSGNEKIIIELNPAGESDIPDEVDQRNGALLPDVRLVVKEGIEHAREMTKILHAALEVDIENPICSFCARPQNKVNILVGGPIVHICNHCLRICNEVANEYDG